jgi:hypothetical protein
MIQAGTMSTGSACTSRVVGVYWISSIRSLRSTTLPGVAARLPPTSKLSVPAGAAPSVVRRRSSSQFSKPRSRFWPCSFCVRASNSGLLARWLDGDAASSASRAAKASSCWWYSVTPSTSRVLPLTSVAPFW